MAEPRKVKKELDEFLLWQTYEDAGGQLTFPDWKLAGKPTPAFEQAAFSYLARLDAYLANQIEVAGLSMGEYSAVLDAEWDELFGGGKEIGKTTNWAKVNSYFTGLTADEQRRIEDEANALQQQKVDIARQQQLLPLGQGGTGTEQVWIAENTIKNLQIQMEASPDYLKPVIQGQINSLRDFQVSQKEIEKIKASGKEPDEATALALKLYGNRREKGYSFTSWLRDTAEGQAANQYVGQQTGGEVSVSAAGQEPGSFAQQFAEKYGMSAESAQQTGLRYSQHPESGEFANLTREERTSLAWVGTEAGGGEVVERKVLPPFEPPGFEGVSTTGGVNWREEFERRYPSILGEFTAKPEAERTAGGWTELLEKRRTELKEKWMKQSPYERGERPSAFAPMVRTVQF